MKNSEDYVNTDEMTDAVFNALRNDDAKTLKQYLNSGVGDVNLSCGESRNTLLHESIEYGSYQCMIVLLNHGANTNLKNGRGETPLKLATKLENRQGCILAIQLAVRNRKERLKEEDKQRMIKDSRQNTTNNKNKNLANQQSLRNVQNMLRMNLESAGSLVTSLESDTIRARSLVQGLEYQLQELEHQIQCLSLQVESSSNSCSAGSTSSSTSCGTSSSTSGSTSGSTLQETSSGLSWSGDICCMICWDIPLGHVLQCTQGHLLCCECFSNPQIDVCPECRVPLDIQIRNRAVERLISQIKPS